MHNNRAASLRAGRPDFWARGVRKQFSSLALPRIDLLWLDAQHLGRFFANSGLRFSR